MDPRDQKALLIAAMCDIEKRDGYWLVPSQTKPGKFYRVTIAGRGSCTCKDFVEDHNVCKHIRAVRIMLRRDLGLDGIVDEMR